MLYNCVKRRRL
jgi:hypothetical protein